MEDWKERLKTPKLGVAAIVESPCRKKITVISRKYPPRGFAFPGGFQNIGETTEETAIREVEEETGIKNPRFIDVLNICSKPEFDPRLHVVALHLIMRIDEFQEVEGNDDALSAFWMEYNSDELYNDFNYVSQLTLNDYREWRKNERRMSKLR